MFFLENRSAKSETVNALMMFPWMSEGWISACSGRARVTPCAGGYKCTATIIMIQAIIPVTIKTTIIHNKIDPKRLRSVMAATVDDNEKKTSGTTMVKSKLRKISPKGLKTTAFSLKINPKMQPKEIEPRRTKDEP